ncbi:MAG: EAL domain-containing protein [Spirochaetales bacterium]|nr:EAL domain-containing protein [Spirochaetales bacterium]
MHHDCKGDQLIRYPVGSRLMIETIVDFSRKLGIKTIAEHVHNDSLALIIAEIGIDFSRGFFIVKPDPAVSLELSC